MKKMTIIGLIMALILLAGAIVVAYQMYPQKPEPVVSPTPVFTPKPTLKPAFTGEPLTLVSYSGGPNVTFPPIPSNLSRYPFTGIGYSDRSPGPGAKDVPLNTSISVSFWRPPGAVKLEIKPEVEISHVKKEYVQVASGKFTFYPAKPLQPETNYTVKITFGAIKFPENIMLTFAPYENITWHFTTMSIANGGSKNGT